MVIGQILAASRDSPDGLGTDADAQAKRRLYEYIRTCPQAVIATATRDGKPEAARVNIAVTADLEVIFETTSATRKFSNLEDNPSAAFVIGWEDEKTLQYEGIVDRPEGHALERVRTCYLSRFPEKASHQYWPGNMYFRVRPSWIRLSSYYSPRKIEEYRFLLYEAPASPSWWHRLLGPERRHHD